MMYFDGFGMFLLIFVIHHTLPILLVITLEKSLKDLFGWRYERPIRKPCCPQKTSLIFVAYFRAESVCRILL
jgi:hypothetical protein